MFFGWNFNTIVLWIEKIIGKIDIDGIKINGEIESFEKDFPLHG